MDPAWMQGDHPVRFEWGAAGGLAIAEGADVVVVVDVLCFTTTLSVAVDQGTVVLPYRADGGDARAFAEQHRATLARPRRDAAAGQITLSPVSVRSAEVPERLVLPSRNGAALVADLSSVATTVVGACLRNARAVAAWLAREHDPDTAVVAVVAAGECWPDGTLRPAVEDLWGAGAVLAALEDHDWPGLSPEAALAGDAYRLIAGREASHLAACVSGRELAAAGDAADIEVAAEVAASSAVPLLSDRGFVAAP